MRVVVPYDVREPNTRLSDVLAPGERTAFAAVMLADVLRAIRGAGGDPELLATGPIEAVDIATAADESADAGSSPPTAEDGVAAADWSDIPVTVDERPLTPAVNAVLADADEPIAVVMADLPLATPHALGRLFDVDGDVVAVPGRGGGTNALVVGHPGFRVDYHGASFRDHRRIADDIGATFAVVDSFRLATDVDERSDLVEVLLHGDGEAAAWLADAGFSVETGDGRVDVVRADPPESERLK